MDFKRIFEAGYTTQYFIRGFFIRNDNGELDKKYWGGHWPNGGSYWVNNLKFDILEGGRHQDGAAWKKEKPTEDFLKEIWNDWHCKSMDEDYSGIDHLEIWQAQKMGTYLKSRWQGAMKVDSFKLTESKLKEGGNLTVNGHSATKLQVGKMDDEQFGDFKEDFLAFLLSVSDIFMEKTGYPIWNREDLLFDGKVFSGSTRAFFQKDHSTYANKKPKVGDFDVQVPEEIFPTFHKFVLEDLPNMEIGDFTIHGCSVSPGQDHCLVKANKNYPEVGAEYIQIDWEYVPFKNNVPTDFATFAHYSSWEDIENNVKGVFMKYLMRALVSTIDERENVTIVSAKTGKPLASANKSQLKHFMGFSVDKGIRTKYIPYLDENGKPLVVDGQEYWVEAPSKESVYTQDVGAMYQLIFGDSPTESEKKDLHSFVRTLNNLMSKFDEERVRKVFFLFCKLLWGPGAQGISAFDPEEDKEVKGAAYEQFIKAFPNLQQYQADIVEMKDTYYSNYKVTEKK